MLKGFLMLIGFTTIIPVPQKIEFDKEKMGKSFLLFPLIGVITGGITALFYNTVSNFTENLLIAALLTVILDVILTGGLHLDGAADSADGLLSYRTRERMLEIMKDSRIGTNGVIILIIIFAMKILLIPEIGAGYVFAASVTGRMNGVIHAGIGVYARKDGMGLPVVEFTGFKEALAAVLISMPLVYFATDIKGIAAMAVTIVFGLFFLRFVSKKINGVTGDTIGAAVECSTVIMLLAGVFIK